jgi:NitT/TauT family transport system permease protein
MADGPLGPRSRDGSARRTTPAAGFLVRLYRRFGLSTLSIIVGLALWEFLSRVIVDNRLFLAAPSQVVVGLIKLAESGDLARHVYVSTIEFVIGYVIACIAGIALGLAMASSPRVKKALQPWVSGFYATPVVALAPLFILWFGIGVWSKIAVVISLVIFTVSINTEVGLLQTSQRLVDTLRSFGATGNQIFWKLSLPSAMPFILAGLKLGIGRGLIGVVVGELFGARAGLGQLIGQSAESFNMPDLFGGVVILAVAGIVLTAGFSWLERVLVPWNRE